MKALIFLLVLLSATASFAWDQLDFNIFDLHDAIIKHAGKDATFYSVLQLPPTCTTQEISKAYRRLSRTMHPDKNPDKKTRELFTHITSVVELLKNDESRERYDQHLKFGIPKWRGGAYLYSRYRPSLGTALIFVLATLSFAQYTSGYAKYYYDHYKLDQITQELKDSNLYQQLVRQKVKKGGKAELDQDEILNVIAEAYQTDKETLIPTTPHLKDLWIITVPKNLVWFIFNHKQVLKEWKERRKEEAEMKRLMEEEERELQEQEQREEEEARQLQELRAKQTEEKKARKRAKHEAKQLAKQQAPAPKPPTNPITAELLEEVPEEELNTSTTWKPEELSQLSKLVVKFPGGTPGRWVLISRALKRPVDAVADMANKIKEDPRLVLRGFNE